MNSHEKAQLDAWITREPVEQEMWCPECRLDASECKQVEEHEGKWEEYKARDAWDYADALYERGIDSDE